MCYQEVPVEGHEGKTTVGLAPFPVGEEKEVPMDSLIQVSFTGDETLIDYTLGVTMRNREGTLLKVEEQAAEETASSPAFATRAGTSIFITLNTARKRASSPSGRSIATSRGRNRRSKACKAFR